MVFLHALDSPSPGEHLNTRSREKNNYWKCVFLQVCNQVNHINIFGKNGSLRHFQSLLCIFNRVIPTTLDNVTNSLLRVRNHIAG